MFRVIEDFAEGLSLKVIENGTIRKLGCGFLFAFQKKVIMALPCIISEIKRVIGRKSRFFHTPCIQRPRQPVVISYHIFI